jgi:hypothetical protein
LGKASMAQTITAATSLTSCLNGIVSFVCGPRQGVRHRLLLDVRGDRSLTSNVRGIRGSGGGRLWAS